MVSSLCGGVAHPRRGQAPTQPGLRRLLLRPPSRTQRAAGGGSSFSWTHPPLPFSFLGFLAGRPCVILTSRVGRPLHSLSPSSAALSRDRACAGDRSPHARSSTPTWRDLSASGLAIAAEPIAIDRGANGRHGAVSVSSLSDCGPVVRSLRGGTRSVSCAPQHITLSGGLRPWRPPTPSFDNMIHHTS